MTYSIGAFRQIVRTTPAIVGLRLSVQALAVVFLLTSSLRAQSAPRLLPVNGTVFDSLQGTPVSGAAVSLVGLGRTTITDERGRFHLDSIPPGSYKVSVQYDQLDSIGLTGLSTVVSVESEADTIRVGSPSFPSLWAAACGTKVPAADTGFVFGTIRLALTERSAANANVAISWTELAVDSTALLRQHRWTSDVQADAQGNYAICGLPTTAVFQAAARLGNQQSDTVHVMLARQRIRRRDLLVGPGESRDAPWRRVVGHVFDEHATPVAGARILVPGQAEARSDASGHFAIPKVLPGTREFEFLAIGAEPLVVAVDVSAADSTMVDVRLRRVSELDRVTVTASALRSRMMRDISDRQRLGLGKFVDSTTIRRYPSVAIAVAGAIEMDRVCALFIDGLRTEQSELRFRHPDDIALVEIHRGASVPFEFRPSGRDCTVMLVWTKSWVP